MDLYYTPPKLNCNSGFLSTFSISKFPSSYLACNEYYLGVVIFLCID